MGAPETYGSGTTPQTSDTPRMLLVKLIIAESGSGPQEQEVYTGNYGGLAPNAPNPAAFVPDVDHAIAKDLDSPYQTFWWNPDTQLWE